MDSGVPRPQVQDELDAKTRGIDRFIGTFARRSQNTRKRHYRRTKDTILSTLFVAETRGGSRVGQYKYLMLFYEIAINWPLHSYVSTKSVH